MAHEFQHPVIGQEAVCPDGLGRVVAFQDNFPHQSIQVDTYVRNRGCHWAPSNVQLVSIGKTTPAAQRVNGERALEILRDIEWHQPSSNSSPSCPYCGNHQHQGHTKDCDLAKIIKPAPTAGEPT